MLVLLIVFAIYLGLQKLLERPIKKKICQAQNVDEALVYRKNLKRIRSIFFALCFSTYVLFVFWINFGVSEKNAETLQNSFMGVAIGVVMLYYYLRQQKKYKEFIGNVSTLDKKQYLAQNAHFALFLRGFEEDDYTKESVLSNMTHFEKFSEYKFMEILQSKISTCAIGMTKEADSPYGATRVYVDDTCWKEDVKELMEKADYIFILVNDKPSCIWEIEQSKEMLGKTTFLIEDKQKYENVRKFIVHDNFLPEIPIDCSEAPHLLLRFINGTFKFKQFDNTIDSYANILQVSVLEKTQQKRKGCLWGISFLIVLIVVVSYVNNQHIRHKQQYSSQIGKKDSNGEIPVGDVVLRVYTAEDKSCSIKAPLGFMQLTPEENQRISLKNSSNSFSITIAYERKSDLYQIDIKNVREYAMSIYDFYKNDWNTEDIELVEESNWDRGYRICFTVSMRGEIVDYIVYTLIGEEHFIQMTFAGLSPAYEKYFSKIEEMANSFKFM